MGKVFELLQQPWYGVLGNTVSIVGFALTIFVFINVRNIRRYYLFTARSPALIGRLSEHSVQLSTYLNDFDNFRLPISEELARTEATLAALERTLTGEHKRIVRSLRKSVRKYEHVDSSPKWIISILHRLRVRQSLGKDSLWAIYLQVIKIEQQVRDVQEEQKWER